MAPEALEERPLRSVLHPKTADALARHLDLNTVGDLLEYFPRRYLPRGELTQFSDLVWGQEVSIISRVLSVTTRRLHSRRGSIAEVLVTDQLAPEESLAPGVDDAGRLDALAGSSVTVPTGPQGNTMSLSFFNAWTASKELAVGDHVMFSGKVSEFKGQLTLTNPHYAVLSEPGALDGEAHGPDAPLPPLPVYPATAKYPTDRIEAAVRTLLEKVDLRDCHDPVPGDLHRKHGLPSIAQAYRLIHQPREDGDPHRALRYFRYREALVLQVILARRAAVLDAQRTKAYPAIAGGLLEAFNANLPFILTSGQKRVGEEIGSDIAGERPMNRLLQGDVGSGKTLVALRAMLQVADGGGQSVLLAPTEVLAGQHERSIRTALGELAEKAGVVVLTASMPAATKRRVLADIASGSASIVIGTHAVLAEYVSFAELGLAVVDEQHRFGVRQRHALMGTGGSPVHRLVMTATPIPRSVAMTVFGDLAVSVLDELPAGRQEVATHVVSLANHPSWEARLWQRAREEIDRGHQVFVVVPTIGDGSDDADVVDDSPTVQEGSGRGSSGNRLQSVEGLTATLRSLPVLSGCRIEALHGKMDGATKAETMNGMAQGDIDLLVATTVIEVGVDVPNATLMIIMDADRLGMSTLHQLRGRIGRGGHAGTCLLVTEQDSEGASMPRLDAVASTRDGFELSTLDLEQRREGDILGDSQSGRRSTLRNLSVVRHAKIIEQARADARELVGNDPQLERYPTLRHAVVEADSQENTEYLYRG
ncbi:ATP-dependent DNA helicase RecG [uncultured Kocuria sp.]|uniref:ATP-dependent DNA helicase RecG n=1 Tax=uncultured Kocuria sp. TaxID=259305 RepID=UPI002597BB9A|nr:ATP-dependent DNA helicase RecG [uncultured Kocuria sp.]MCT1368330.1 ATP-dependent DNA helicase RecG [Rothia sp. p3-SID1597]